jgi:hypothetical protein
MDDYKFSYDDLDSMINNAAFDYNSVNNIDLSGVDLGGINGLDLSGIDTSNINGLDLPAGFKIDENAFSLDDIDAMINDAIGGTGGFKLADLTGAGDVDVNAPLLTPDGVDESLVSGGDAKVGSGGYYDEITGEFIYDENGGLRGPLDETSGTNKESMDGYTYDKKSGTWTTPSGEKYTPDKPPSYQTKSGAQVMVDAGALPSGYNGLTPTKGSTADTKKDDTKTDTKTDTKKTDTSKTDTKKTSDGLGSLLPLLLALLAMNKGGGGGGGKSTVIPGLTATQRQTPYSQQQKAPGYRPGQGGISYFDQTQYAPKMAAGGIARLLDGPGDGVSDSIPAVIDGGMAGGGQPAKVARGEYIMDARTVAALGNGSTDAGAERLDKMRQNILRDDRKAGVGKDSKAYRHLMA